jgi:hypothetical protein
MLLDLPSKSKGEELNKRKETHHMADNAMLSNKAQKAELMDPWALSKDAQGMGNRVYPPDPTWFGKTSPRAMTKTTCPQGQTHGRHIRKIRDSLTDPTITEHPNKRQHTTLPTSPKSKERK